MIRYELPKRWILYDASAVMAALVEAKSAVQSLTTLPYQKSWVEALQELQLKREVAGTSRIEGAEFTERELDEAVRPDVSPEALRTRSQRQARAAMQAYRWIGELPTDRPISTDLVREVHRRLVTGCDDDHCPPGILRERDYNVTFGIPPHRGAEGGPVCEEAFNGLLQSAQTEFRDHDPLVQAMALHYHLAAMHPFLDGNGRTARAMEALMLRRAGLTDRAFVAMSNYYYDEKPAYLRILGEVRQGGCRDEVALQREDRRRVVIERFLCPALGNFFPVVFDHHAALILDLRHDGEVGRGGAGMGIFFCLELGKRHLDRQGTGVPIGQVAKAQNGRVELDAGRQLRLGQGLQEGRLERLDSCIRAGRQRKITALGLNMQARPQRFDGNRSIGSVVLLEGRDIRSLIVGGEVLSHLLQRPFDAVQSVDVSASG
jgi:fido (protein-threonine AMPylation protein)